MEPLAGRSITLSYVTHFNNTNINVYLALHSNNSLYFKIASQDIKFPCISLFAINYTAFSKLNLWLPLKFYIFYYKTTLKIKSLLTAPMREFGNRNGNTWHSISNIAPSIIHYACVRAVTQHIACVSLGTFGFGPQSVHTSVVRATHDKMANRTKASEQLSEFAASQKVCEFYSAQRRVVEIRGCLLSCRTFVDHFFFFLWV